MPSMTLRLSKEYQKKVAVISHERSGTHFLMNTLALNFNYITNPWWNLDFEQGLNFHAPQSLLDYFKQVHNKPVLNVLKSHHPVEFFVDIMDYLRDQFILFYIYRDPRDTMLSNWKLISYYHTQKWDEGPKSDSVGEFLRAEPRGAMLRYQKRQEKTVLHRWQHHVEGWLDYSEDNGDGFIMTLRYEDLNLDFNNTVKKIGAFLGRPVIMPRRPGRRDNVIKPGKGKVHAYREAFSPADNEFVLNTVGEAMKRFGYR